MNYSLIVSLTILLTAAAPAENWPQWRGPNYDGSSGETKLPTEFSKTNWVLWTAALPGPSAATPIIWGDRVFVSSTDARTKALRAICFDFKTGKELWSQEVGVGFSQDRSSNFASPSPVTDGQVVYFYYGTGELAAFDFAGQKLWSRSLEKDYGQFAYQWTYAASPTLFGGKLYVQVLQRNEPVHGRGRKDGPIDSFLLALDPQSGKEIWKQVRPSDAVMESYEAYSTPIPFTHAGRTEILITGGDCITGHDAKAGTELWRWGSWNPGRIGHWRLVPSPVMGGGVVLVAAPKGSPIFAVKAGCVGAVPDKDLAWTSADRQVSTDVATPLFYKGRFYALNGERRTLARVDPATGKADWIGELGRRAKIEASPTGADDKIYFQDFLGAVFVVAAAEQFKVLHVAEMGDPDDDQLRATIPVSQGRLFIRTGNKLYCVGKAD